MTSKVKVLAIHVDIDGKEIGIEFRKMGNSGQYEPLEPYRIRHIIPASEDFLSIVTTQVTPQLLADLLEVKDVRSNRLISELHTLRETRQAQLEARQIHEEHKQKLSNTRTAIEEHNARLATAAQEMHSFNERMRLMKEEIKQITKEYDELSQTRRKTEQATNDAKAHLEYLRKVISNEESKLTTIVASNPEIQEAAKEISKK